MRYAFEFIVGVVVLLFMASTFVQIFEPSSLSHSISVYEESEVISTIVKQQQYENKDAWDEEMAESPAQEPLIVEVEESIIEPVVPKGTIFCPAEVQTDRMCLDVYEPVCGALKQNCIGDSCLTETSTFGNGCNACSDKNIISYTAGECDAEPSVN